MAHTHGLKTAAEIDATFRRDGGPAGGMSLRDYFAGQALAGAVMRLSADTTMSRDLLVAGSTITAYLIADAMIAERAK